MALALPKLPSKTPLPLKDRIEALRAEIDAFIDALVEKDAGYGVPRQVLRDLITNRATVTSAIQVSRGPANVRMVMLAGSPHEIGIR